MALRSYQSDPIKENDVNAYAANTIHSCDFTNLITIIVGEDEQSFMVHKDMLCAKSKYFKSACSELWASGREKVVRPTQGTPEQFKMYSEWVYTSHLSINAEDPGQQLDDLIGMFILGDFLNDYQLRNATMDLLITTILGSTHVFGLDQLDRVYAATPTGSPLREFTVWWVLANVSQADLYINIARYPAELVQELALAVLRRSPILEDKESVKVLREIIKPEKESI